MPEMKDARFLIMATHGFEQSELEVPLSHLRDTGATVHVASLDGEAIHGWNQTNWGNKVEADLKIANARAQDYDCLVLPGGQINPDLLRVEEDAISLVRDFAAKGKIIAAICHAPWLLIEADLVKDRDATSYYSLATDMKNAGANWRDEEVVVSGNIITSRKPDDLHSFVAKIIEKTKSGAQARSAA